MFVQRKRPLLIAIIAVLLCAVAMYVWAGTTTAATGGSAISADTAATGGSGAWTPLTGPKYNELINGDIASGGFVTLTAPAGFAFNTANPISVVLIAGDRMAAANMNEASVGGNVASTTNGSLNVSATTISFFVSSKSRGNTLNTIQWQGIQVRPLQGTPLATGNILLGLPGGSAMPSSTNAGTLTVVPGALARLLTVLPGQSFVSGGVVTGTPAGQVAGSPFVLSRLVATDKFNNIIPSYTGLKSITYSGPAAGCATAPTYTTNVSFSSGTSTTTLNTTLIRAETTSISASDGAVTGPASSAFVVAPAPVSQLVVTLPGQTFTPCLGNSGTPADQAEGVSFNISAITATDRFFNVVTSYTGSKSLSYSGPAGTNTYTSPVNFASGQSTTPLATTISTAQTTSITVGDGSLSGPASSSFTVVSTVSSFDAFDAATPAGAVSGVIKTKVAGTPFSMAVVALTAGPAVATGFTGTVKVDLVDSTSAPCAGAVVLALPNQTFAAGDNGRRTIAAISEPNSWKNVRVRISYPAAAPTITSCSNDNFSIRPDRLGLIKATDQDDKTAGSLRTLANLSVPGGVVHKAGQPFTISATALNASGATTTNYEGAPNGFVSACSTASVCPTSLGTLSITAWTNSLGVIATSNATYTEVGAVNVVLQDQAFAAVDAADSTPAERYVSSAASPIGRFVPDHFSVVSSSIVQRTDLAACTTPAFTYMDEPLAVSFSLLAQSAAPANATTKNYTGALATLNPTDGGHLNFGAIDAALPTALVARITAITRANPGRVTTATAHKLATGGTVFVSGVAGMTELNNKSYEVVVIDANNFTINASTASFSSYVSGGNASRLALVGSTGTWLDGAISIVSTLMLQRSAQPDGPFNNVTIGIGPRDPDGVTTSFSNLDTDGDGAFDRQKTNGTPRFFFGRLLLGNAYGSELLNLTIPIQAQFWTGSAFAKNTLDNCTAVSLATSVSFANYLGGLDASNMKSPGNVQTGTEFVGGTGRLVLTKPMPAPANKGSADLTIKLDNEAKNYLRGRGAGTKYDQNPSARATFGVYKSGPIIYVRETY